MRHALQAKGLSHTKSEKPGIATAHGKKIPFYKTCPYLPDLPCIAEINY